jgi:hypothetical protein
MRKLLTLMLAAGALAVPAATAAHGNPGSHGHGQGTCHGHARVTVVLKGTLANDPAAGDVSFMLTVLHTNRWGRLYKQTTQPYTVDVSDSTRYVKNDQPSTLDALALNDVVVVKSTKMSRCDLRNGDPNNPPQLTAKMVVDQTGDTGNGS